MSTSCPTCNKPGYRKADSVITVRLSKQLHQLLKLVAADRLCSVNELCVNTLQAEVEREAKKRNGYARVS